MPFSSESLYGFSLISAFLTLVAVSAMGSLFRECEFGGIDLLDCENTPTNTPFCEGMLGYFKLL